MIIDSGTLMCSCIDHLHRDELQQRPAKLESRLNGADVQATNGISRLTDDGSHQYDQSAWRLKVLNACVTCAGQGLTNLGRHM